MGTVQLATIDDALIQRVKERLVEACHPQEIYLFGSAARDEAGEGSDLDLLVVMELEAGVKTYEKAAELHALFDGWFVPLDILVQTPDRFERDQQLPGFIARTAKREGRLLYSRKRHEA